MHKYAIKPLILLLFVFYSACSSIADYSLEAYTYATELKAKSIALVGASKDPYAKHKDKAEKLLVEISAAYEFAAGIEKNNEAAKMWSLIRSPDENLMGGFIGFWKQKQPGGMSAGFISEFKKDVAYGFDRLICLEANKREATKCPKIK
jgi:hypothetical protein